MEKICPYCKKPVSVKRVDALYCSSSCRQSAYMKRKTAYYTLAGTADQSSDEPVEFSIRGQPAQALQINTCEQEEYPVLQDSKPVFLNALSLQADKLSDDDDALSLCISYGEDSASYQVAEKLRCLIECTLTLSEAEHVKTCDLVELCNGFTRLIHSEAYKDLPDEFPYTTDTISFRDKLKRFCLQIQDRQQVRFGLRQEDKIQLIVMRFYLSGYVPKKTFRELFAKQ